MCVGHAAFTARQHRPGLASSSHSFVERRISEPVEHHHKFAGLFCVLLVGQFTIGMFGIECFVNGVQGVKPVANHHAAHPRFACDSGESPVQFGCHVAWFHLPAVFLVHLERGSALLRAQARVSVALRPIKALPPARRRRCQRQQGWRKRRPKRQPSRMFRYFVYSCSHRAALRCAVTFFEISRQ